MPASIPAEPPDIGPVNRERASATAAEAESTEDQYQDDDEEQEFHTTPLSSPAWSLRGAGARMETR
jgi:hypothetical protein